MMFERSQQIADLRGKEILKTRKSALDVAQQMIVSG